MPGKSKREGWIDWTNSEAKKVLLEHLFNKKISLDEQEMPTEELWEFVYKGSPAFKHVVYSQFKERLKDHRKQVGSQMGRTSTAAIALANFRKLNPKKKYDAKGRPLWDGHPAQVLLKEDVKNKRHKGVRPSAFRLTRKEYQEFELDVFRNHIYQEIRLRRFYNYLRFKREEKEKNQKKAMEKARKAAEVQKKAAVKKSNKKKPNETKNVVTDTEMGNNDCDAMDEDM